MPDRLPNNHRPILPLLMMGIGVGLLFVVAYVFFSQQQVTQARLSTPFPEISTASEADTFPEIPRVSAADAKSAFDQGNATIVDVRDADSFASSHVKGAVNIPLSDLPNRLSELDKNTWIIPYCT